MKSILAATVLLAAHFAFADGTGSKTAPSSQPTVPQAPVETLVTVNAKGNDVRDVLTSLFTQDKASFVVDPNVHYVLWLSLNKVDFDAALGIICHLANLKATEDGGIWYVKQKPFVKEHSQPKLPPLTNHDLAKYVTLKMHKSSLAEVLAKLTGETGVPIAIDKSVPSFRLDAHLYRKSLKYALIVITKATHLSYKLDGPQVLVYKPVPPNPVHIVGG